MKTEWHDIKKIAGLKIVLKEPINQIKVLSSGPSQNSGLGSLFFSILLEMNEEVERMLTKLTDYTKLSGLANTLEKKNEMSENNRVTFNSEKFFS